MPNGGPLLTSRSLVTCPANGKYVPEFTINAAEIVELVEAGNENIQPVKPPPPKATLVSQPTKKFEDPAILSVGKRPAPVSRPSIPNQWTSTSMERMDSSRTATGREERSMARDVPTPTAQLLKPMQKISVAEDEADDAEAALLEELDGATHISFAQPVAKVQAKRTRKRKGRKDKEETPQDPAITVTPSKDTPKTKGSKQTPLLDAKGWRQTPLLEPNPSFQPFSTLKRKGRRNGRVEENGWATEDATDVQEMGDFDFEGSLAKFDKKTVFNQIQAEDTIAEGDRLVAHNRLPRAKPGTAGGKNLHPTENVLDIPNGRVDRDAWNSEAGDSDVEEQTSQRDTGSGRTSRRGGRAESKLGNNRQPVSRKGSAGIPGIQPARTLSVRTSQGIRPYPFSNIYQIPTPASKPAFFLVPSDRRCEPISALQMLNLENIADNELGLCEDMMTENAGRGIAEVALSALNTGGRGLTQGKTSNIPTVVVYAGNNKSGMRAVAAGRHIRNHGLNVVICVLGLERESELLVGLRRQVKVFRSFGGKIVNKVELFEYLKSLDAPIELIIDGLLGLTISFEELRTGDQSTAYELIEWANRSKASVLAIDIPTGIDPTSGKVSIIDGRQLYIHAKYVVAMGAPKKGLLETMGLGEGVADEDGNSLGDEWQLFVADIGLGAAVWKKAGTKIRRGVEFEGSWVLGMRFQGGAE
jgi:enhancer of mRNA-decapping protein 3